MSLTDKLRDASSQPRKGRGRQAFLAKKKEISQALAEGTTAKEIWEILHEEGVIPIQYRTFVEYVNRYILTTEKEKQNQPEPETAKAQVAEKKEVRTENEPKQLKDESSGQFDYKATKPSQETKDRLI